MGYARKVCGQAPPGKSGYHGSFDYQGVVDAASLPEGKHLDQHRVAWKEFRRLFDEAWRRRAA